MNKTVIFIICIGIFLTSWYVFLRIKKREIAMTKIIDLTHTVTNAMPISTYDDPVSIRKIRTLTEHHYNDWQICSGMHVGTHIDGPGHLTNNPILMSDLPVDKFVGKGYVIDARNKPLDVSLLNSMPVEDGLIVLILTGFDKKFGTQEYYNNYPTLSVEFARELVKRKIKMIGIDFFSPDNYPFEVHKIFFEHTILIIENLTNLESLLGVKKFSIIALPIKTATDSSLARVIAMID